MKTGREKLSDRARGFTLIEIMVVVGIIGMIMAIGAPTLYKMLHREGFTKTVGDMMDLCATARARAILRGTTTEIIFHPHERRCELTGGAGDSDLGAPATVPTTVNFGNATVEMLDVNLLEYKDAPVAHVRFFPNGTSDELTLILRSENNEWRKISLEITTGLASQDSDPHHWK
jgi:prepilin-type N-terminal cleavage/methylation domain-containing protein